MAGVFVELPGNDGAELFWHRGPICVKVGVTEVVTVISIVVPAAHWPDAGVKVYVVVPTDAVLIDAGFHVPVMAGVFVELPGSAGAALFWHRGPIAVKAGAIEAVTSISIVLTVAHWPDAGVKVYVVVPTDAVLTANGSHVPVILLLDVNGNDGAALFWHRGPICVNVGTIEAVTTISIVVLVAHWPDAAVKV